MGQIQVAPAPVAVLALGDPSRSDDGIPMRVMGRVRPLIGEILGVRSGRTSSSRPPATGSVAPPAVPPPPALTGDRSGSDHRGSSRILSPPEPSPRPRAPIEWIEAGTRLQGLEAVLAGRRRVVLLDTVQVLGRPGQVHHWHLRCGPEHRLSGIRCLNGRSRLGMHHLALWLEDELPPGGTDLIGVEPADLSPGENLSRPIRRLLPSICSEVAGILIRVLDEEGW